MFGLLFFPTSAILGVCLALPVHVDRINLHFFHHDGDCFAQFGILLSSLQFFGNMQPICF
jgi:hypothetical protein